MFAPFMFSEWIVTCWTFDLFDRETPTRNDELPHVSAKTYCAKLILAFLGTGEEGRVGGVKTLIYIGKYYRSLTCRQNSFLLSKQMLHLEYKYSRSTSAILMIVKCEFDGVHSTYTISSRHSPPSFHLFPRTCLFPFP